MPPRSAPPSNSAVSYPLQSSCAGASLASSTMSRPGGVRASSRAGSRCRCVRLGGGGKRYPAPDVLRRIILLPDPPGTADGPPEGSSALATGARQTRHCRAMHIASARFRSLRSQVQNPLCCLPEVCADDRPRRTQPPATAQHVGCSLHPAPGLQQLLRHALVDEARRALRRCCGWCHPPNHPKPDQVRWELRRSRPMASLMGHASNA